ncbi:GH39 family glycosyl hydrolase [Synoicihabitans lomoniglobus]|uniref:Beta-xylosidase n=1 Tax=Synoicihabitans lomoniglobus TaxID=2909285 RepID=A0AAF0CRH7_9BACT|nr:beta-xylosidase [Opitutaceae bacterium LMO-M01]WED66694.1 beta-xylosidase [Opitutaceae bacterium LMO-M01]
MRLPLAPLLLLGVSVFPTLSINAEPITITVHADEPVGEPLRPIWNYFGYDEAGTTLTSEGRHLLGELNELSDLPIRIRVHHLLTSGDGTLALKWSSTNAYTEDENGHPVYDWTMIDAIMDELTQPGIEPFVQAGFMPQDLSSQPDPYTPQLTRRGLPKDMVSGGAFYPPKDYRKWQNLIAAWAQHSVDRYGRERAESWLWEPWNEPESPYWKGTMEEFFMLYDHFAAGVKSVLPGAKVGGPHVTDPGWKNGDVFMEAFLEHCRSGLNAATGEIGAPLDFIAFHAKGTTRLDEQGRVEMNLRNQLKTIDTYGRIIATFPEFRELPIYIGESDPEGCAGCPATLDPERDYRRTSQFAAYTAAAFMRKQDLMTRHGLRLEGAVSWAFTFHDQPWFNGLRALTTNEIALPVLNAFRLMQPFQHQQRVRVENAAMISTDDIMADSVRGRSDVGAVATTRAVLLWNYHDVSGEGESVEVKLVFTGVRSSAIDTGWFAMRVDENNANAYSRWRAMGEPQNPSPDQVLALQTASQLQPLEVKFHERNRDERVAKLVLPPQSVVLVIGQFLDVPIQVPPPEGKPKPPPN